MPTNTIQLSVADRIATVTINRPDKLNALNVAVFDDLTHWSIESSRVARTSAA